MVHLFVKERKKEIKRKKERKKERKAFSHSNPSLLILLPHGIIFEPPNFNNELLLFIARLHQFTDDFALAVIPQRLQPQLVATRSLGDGALQLTKPALIASLKVIAVHRHRQRRQAEDEEEEEEKRLGEGDQRKMRG